MPCPLCAGLRVVRDDAGQAPAGRPFCSACRRWLPAVEIDVDERRRLAAATVARVPELEESREAQ